MVTQPPDSGFVSLRILVVDDDSLVLDVLRQYLYACGHRVTAVATSDEAIATRGRFDLGIFDLELGEESGAVLATGMLGSGKITAAIFHTGNPHGVDGAYAKTLGPVVMKGQSLKSLEEVVRHMVPEELVPLSTEITPPSSDSPPSSSAPAPSSGELPPPSSREMPASQEVPSSREVPSGD